MVISLFIVLRGDASWNSLYTHYVAGMSEKVTLFRIANSIT